MGSNEMNIDLRIVDWKHQTKSFMPLFQYSTVQEWYGEQLMLAGTKMRQSTILSRVAQRQGLELTDGIGA